MIGLERSKLNALTPVVKRRVVASISVRGWRHCNPPWTSNIPAITSSLIMPAASPPALFLVPARLLNHVLGDSLLNWFGKYYISLAAI